MTNDHHPHQFVLSVYPNAQGLGYVLFTGRMRLADWGVKRSRGTRKNEKMLSFVRKCFEKYPDIIVVIEDWVHAPHARAKRIHAFYEQLVFLAEKQGIPVTIYSWEEVTRCFAHVPPHRYQIALAIAERIPELHYDVPPDPKIWIGPNARQALYDAAALGLTYYAEHAKGRQ